MPTYKAPVDDVLFLLNDVFGIERYANLPGFADASPDVVEAILGEAAKFCEDELTPLNRVGDIEGCTRQSDGSVTTPKGFKEAFRKIVEGGWVGISAPSEFGGQGLPMFMTQQVNEFLSSANLAFAMYSGLTQGAIAAILVHGSPEQKKALSAEDGGGRMDRHHEPHRAALRHRSRHDPRARRSSRATAATRSPARRSSSPPASTTCRRTSFTWCWRGSKARPKAPGEFRCLWFPR